jgi:hypothetical protein
MNVTQHHQPVAGTIKKAVIVDENKRVVMVLTDGQRILIRRKCGQMVGTIFK